MRVGEPMPHDSERKAAQDGRRRQIDRNRVARGLRPMTGSYADEKNNPNARCNRQPVSGKRRGIIAIDDEARDEGRAGKNDERHPFQTYAECRSGERSRCPCRPAHANGPDRRRERQQRKRNLYVVMIDASRLELKEAGKA